MWCGQREARKRKLAEEKSAFGTYAGELGTTLTYRVKKPGAYGGYKIVTEVLLCDLWPSLIAHFGWTTTWQPGARCAAEPSTRIGAGQPVAASVRFARA